MKSKVGLDPPYMLDIRFFQWSQAKQEDSAEHGFHSQASLQASKLRQQSR
ncbi:hypothetical protein RCCS2_07814 [Roseobacter sp. CCS2]|nr:hypothetical protein RCCS2_07814 [Roseobacter sp. CCS2]